MKCDSEQIFNSPRPLFFPRFLRSFTIARFVKFTSSWKSRLLFLTLTAGAFLFYCLAVQAHQGSIINTKRITTDDVIISSSLNSAPIRNRSATAALKNPDTSSEKRLPRRLAPLKELIPLEAQKKILDTTLENTNIPQTTVTFVGLMKSLKENEKELIADRAPGIASLLRPEHTAESLILNNPEENIIKPKTTSVGIQRLDRVRILPKAKLNTEDARHNKMNITESSNGEKKDSFDIYFTTPTKIIIIMIQFFLWFMFYKVDQSDNKNHQGYHH